MVYDRIDYNIEKLEQEVESLKEEIEEMRKWISRIEDHVYNNQSDDKKYIG